MFFSPREDKLSAEEEPYTHPGASRNSSLQDREPQKNDETPDFTSVTKFTHRRPKARVTIRKPKLFSLKLGIP